MNTAFPSLDEIAEDFLADLRAGAAPNIEAYTTKNPAISDEIAELLSSIELMEQLSKQESSIREHANKPALIPETITTLGEFDIVREIGRGGMGVVYEATDRSLGRRVALKVLHAAALTSQKQIDRFRRESQLAAQLHHTNIVSIYGVGEENGTHFYAMQYVEGTTVAQILHQLQKAASGTEDSHNENRVKFLQPSDSASRQPASKSDTYWQSVARLGIQTADALQYAHGNGILHRDIKPANLLFDDNGTVWVADFGLAKLAELDDLTKTGDVVGTLRYMSPEQLDGQADARSDVYALGLTLYELLTLSPACDAESYKKIFAQKQNQSFALPRSINADIPRDLETIVQKSLAPDPSQRYMTADALSQDLQRFLNDRPILARRVSSLEHAWRWCRRNRAIAWLLAISASLLLMLPIVLGWAYAREAAQRQKTQRTLDVTLGGFDELYRSFLDDEQPMSELTAIASKNLAPATLTKDTARILERMLEVYDRLAQETEGSNNQKLSIESARARRRVGDLYQRLGQFTKAREAHEDAIRRFQNLSASGNHAIEISRSQNAIGSLHMQMYKFRDAHDSHLDALDLLKQSNLSGPEIDFELARTQYLLGKNEEREGRPRRGRNSPPPPKGHSQRRREHLEQAIQYLEASAAKDTPSHRFLLAKCLRETASDEPFAEQGTSPRARAARLLNELVAEFPEVLKYRFELSETYRVIRRGRDDERCIEQLRTAQVLSEQLVSEQSQVAVYRINLAHIYARLGDIYGQREDTSQAETYSRQAIASHRHVIQDFPGLASLSERLSRGTKTRLAQMMFEQFRWEDGVFILRTVSESLRTQLESETGLDSDLVGVLRQVERELADGYDRLGNREQAAEVRSRVGTDQPKSPFMSALDTNNDGAISYDELEFSPEVLRDFDTNKNGTLSTNEIREMYPPPPKREPPPGSRPRPSSGRFFQSIFSYDSNSDQLITRDELPKRMAKGWFRRADRNRNGEITEDELRDVWDRYSRR